MSTQDITYELHKPARRKFKRRSFKMLGINETLQIDLIDTQNYAKQNDGFKYILTVIDIFSKRALAVPLKKKTGLEVTIAMKSFLSKIFKGVKNIQSDSGLKLFSSHFNKLMETLKINHYNTYSSTKAAIVERFQ